MRIELLTAIVTEVIPLLTFLDYFFGVSNYPGMKASIIDPATRSRRLTHALQRESHHSRDAIFVP